MATNFTNIIVSDSIVADSITCDNLITNSYRTETDLTVDGELFTSSIRPTVANNITINSGNVSNSQINMIARNIIIGNQSTATNLTVYGNIDYISSNQLQVKDPLISLNQGGSNITAINSGIEIMGSSNVSLLTLKTYSDNATTLAGFETTGNLKCNISNSNDILSSNGNIGNITTSKINNSGNIYMLPSRKVSLYDQSDNFYEYAGFNFNNTDNRIAYNTPNIDSSHVFFIGTSPTTKNEILSINNNGATVTNLTVSSSANINNLNVSGNVATSLINLNRLNANIVTANIGNITTINNNLISSNIGNITTLNNTLITSVTGNIGTINNNIINSNILTASIGNITTINNNNFNSSNITSNKIINSGNLETGNLLSGLSYLGYNGLNYKVQCFSSTVNQSSGIAFYNNSNVSVENVNSTLTCESGSAVVDNRGNITWELGNLTIGDALNTKNINLYTGQNIRLSANNLIFSGNIDNETSGNLATNKISCTSINCTSINGSSLTTSGNIVSNNSINCNNNVTGNSFIGNSYILNNGTLEINNGLIKFDNTSNARKIVLFDVGNNDYQYYGFNMASAQMGYNVSGTTAFHRFYCGTSTTTKKELMNISNSGVEIIDSLTVGSNINTTANIDTKGLYVRGFSGFSGCYIEGQTNSQESFIDFHSNNLGNVGYDTRIRSEGGNGSNGGGLLRFIAENIVNQSTNTNFTGTITCSGNITGNANIISNNIISNNTLKVSGTASFTDLNDYNSGNIIVNAPLKIGYNNGAIQSCLTYDKTTVDINANALRSTVYTWASHFTRNATGNYTMITLNHTTSAVNFGLALFLDIVTTATNTAGRSSSRCHQMNYIITKETSNNTCVFNNSIGTASATNNGSWAISGPTYDVVASSGILNFQIVAPTVTGTFSHYTVAYQARLVCAAGSSSSAYISNYVTNISYN
jgi:hypothetical protein